MKYFIAFCLPLFLLVSCRKKQIEKQAKEDDQIIQQYIADHNLTATKTASGLYVVIDDPGTGASCNSNSDVKVSYKGYFTNGEVFDSSSAAGIQFNLQQVIEGWTEGIPYFKEGGYGKLLIPSALGYGRNGSGNIKPNTVILFDVKLLQVL
jgi:FKBP-type peptidyl-prolyl cis-trans isomerase FkpA